MKLNLDLPYDIDTDEMDQFLEAEERDALTEQLVVALKEAGIDEGPGRALSREQVVTRSRTIRNVRADFRDALPDLPARVSSMLLRRAVALRYMKQVETAQGTQRWVEFPRQEKDKVKPGRVWGDIRKRLKKHEAALELSPLEVSWLVLGVWQHEKVQDGFTDDEQTWVNDLDEEMARAGAALTDKKAEIEATGA